MKTSNSWLAAALALLPAVAIVYPLSGQTRIDLHSQSKNVDFANALSARPFPVSANLPATCQVGEMWFNTSAAPGQNLFICAATNTWSAVTTGGDAVSTEIATLSAGRSMYVTCTPGDTGTNCTLAVDTRNLAAPDASNEFSGITSFPASTQQVLAAGDPIVCDATRVSVASAGAVTLTATPVIADSVRDGQVCILQNTGAYGIVLLSSSASNLRLASASHKLKPGEPLILVWDKTSSLWTQVETHLRAASQLSNSTPVCSSALAEMASLTLPPASVGDAFEVSILIGKTGGDAMEFRVRQGSVSGADVALAATGAADVRAAITIHIFQYTSDKMAVVSESISQNNSENGVFEINQTANNPLTLSIAHSGCVTPGQNAWIKTATAHVVEAQ
jgi:hypothetical protein